MYSINIDDDVLGELDRRARGLNRTPNDVLRSILELGPVTSVLIPPQPLQLVTIPPALESLAGFLNSDRFQRYNQSVDRFLAILAWLYTQDADRFAVALGDFHRGKRLYFAKTEKEILDSGENVTAKPIPNSPFWALTTLDNRSKRIVIEDLLRASGSSREDIELAMSELPDSGIRRSHRHRKFLAELA